MQMSDERGARLFGAASSDIFKQMQDVVAQGASTARQGSIRCGCASQAHTHDTGTAATGITLAGRPFEFLAFSSSQLKEQSLWMLACRPEDKQVPLGHPGSHVAFTSTAVALALECSTPSGPPKQLCHVLMFVQAVHNILMAAGATRGPCGGSPAAMIREWMGEMSHIKVRQGCLCCAPWAVACKVACPNCRSLPRRRRAWASASQLHTRRSFWPSMRWCAAVVH